MMQYGKALNKKTTTEYQTEQSHTVTVKGNVQCAGQMGKYHVQMEFVGNRSTKETKEVGEEIRVFLKERYLEKEALKEKSGSLQRESGAVQSSTPRGEKDKEDKQ